MKNLIYLFAFLFIGSSFTSHFSNGDRPFENTAITAALALDVKIEQPKSTVSHDGALLLTVSGGTSPYTIQVISTFSPSLLYKKERVELKKIGVGNYTIMVQDAAKHVLQKTIELTPVQ